LPDYWPKTIKNKWVVIMNEFVFTLKNKVYSGSGSAEKCVELIQSHGFNKPGLIIDKKLYENCDIVQKIVGDISNKFRATLYYYSYEFEPSYQLLDEIRDKFLDKELKPQIDCTIGIGGGSVLDTAKGISILTVNSSPALEYKGFPSSLNKPLPMIAIPSTAGTGSELVYNASFIDETTSTKMGINYEKLYPEFAVLDPRIPASAPFSVFASSGCDALVHALESFVSVKQNNITRLFSIEAIRKILLNFPKILSGTHDLDIWNEMQWGAYFAMVGLSNTTSGPAGALSYYAGTNFNIPHGVAGGLFIGAITKYNHNNGYHDYAELSRDYSEKRDNKKRQDLSTSVVSEIVNVLNLAGIGRLSKYGIDVSDLEGFLEFSKKAKAAFDFNPVSINTDDIKSMLKDII